MGPWTHKFVLLHPFSCHIDGLDISRMDDLRSWTCHPWLVILFQTNIWMCISYNVHCIIFTKYRLNMNGLFGESIQGLAYDTPSHFYVADIIHNRDTTNASFIYKKRIKCVTINLALVKIEEELMYASTEVNHCHDLRTRGVCSCLLSRTM